MKGIYQALLSTMDEGKDCIMICIAGHAGSTPRKTGSRMILTCDGAIIGTIGGGKIEAVAMERAKSALEQGQCGIEHYSLTNHDAAGLGMVCGGDLIILYQIVRAGDDRGIYESIIRAHSEKGDSWLITQINSQDIFQRVSHEKENEAFSSKCLFDIEKGLLIEPIKKPSRAIIFGGGHISLELEPILKNIGFNITIIEDRAEFANKERFSHANEIIIGSIDEAYERLLIDNNDYIIILTRGHIHDSQALEHALATNAGYIGMIGSKAKVSATYQGLREKGFKDFESRVHSPIGLPIKAQTPAEIAISIAAELILARGTMG